MRHWEIPRSAMGTRHLVEAALERGISAEACLVGTGLRARDLARGDATVAAWQEVMAAGNLAGLAPDDDRLGLELGLRIPLAAHGVAATAIRAARTPDHLIAISRRFAALLPGLTRVTATLAHGQAAIVVDGRRIGEPARRVLVERDLTGAYLVLSEIAGQDVPMTRLELPFPVRDPAARKELFGIAPTSSGVGIGRMVFGVRSFDGLFAGGDGPELASALADCQKLLQSRRSHSTASHQVMVRLWNAAPDLPDLEMLAASLLTTSRTLRRRLAGEGTSYQKLCDQVRLRIATQMLSDRGSSVRAVATHLGYADTPAFTNAFRRWTGQGPRAWRTSQAAGHNPIWSTSLSKRTTETPGATPTSWRTA